MGRFTYLLEQTLGKVGKNTKSEWYGHIDAVDHGNSNITTKQMEYLSDARRMLPKDYEFNFVAISPKEVRFLEMSDLEEPHPYVVASIKVAANGSITRGLIGKAIYHRLDTIVDPEHYTYPFHKAVAEWEEKNGLLKFASKKDPDKTIGPSGSYNTWIQQIEAKTGFTEENLIAKWDELKKQYLR